MLQTQEYRNISSDNVCSVFFFSAISGFFNINLFMKLLIFKNTFQCFSLPHQCGHSLIYYCRMNYWQPTCTRLAPRIHDFQDYGGSQYATAQAFWNNLAVQSIVSIPVLFCMRLKQKKPLMNCIVFATSKWPTTENAHKIRPLTKGSRNCY